MFLRIALIVFVFVQSESVWASDSQPNGQPVQLEKKKVNKKRRKAKVDQVVCEYVKVTGTHFKSRICKTAAQRDAESREAQQLHRDLTGPTPSGRSR